MELHVRKLRLQFQLSFPRFCFDATSWSSLSSHHHLSYIFRQEEDRFFRSFLDFLRSQSVLTEDISDQTKQYFAAADAVLRHLSLDYRHRHCDPFFQAIKRGIIARLEDLFPFLQNLPESSTLLRQYGRWCVDLNGLAKMLKRQNVKETAATDLEPVRLFPTRREVDRWNHQKLTSLPDPVTYRYYSVDGYPGQAADTQDPASLEWKQMSRLETQLDLRIGAQVMLVKNMNPFEGLVNGAVGVVESFESVPLRSLWTERDIEMYQSCLQPVPKTYWDQFSAEEILQRDIQLPRVRFHG
jgi:hypothetical protein